MRLLLNSLRRVSLLRCAVLIVIIAAILLTITTAIKHLDTSILRFSVPERSNDTPRIPRLSS